MSRGDHELDVAAILRRAQEPDGIAELRRAIDKLGAEKSAEMLRQVLDVVQRNHEQLALLAGQVAALKISTSESSDHLVDVTSMSSFTREFEVKEEEEKEFSVNIPGYTSYFLFRAVSAEVVDRYDPCLFRQAQIVRAYGNSEPVLADSLCLRRWIAPPGRGHPFGCVASCAALAGDLRLRLKAFAPFGAIVKLTFSGDPLVSLPAGQPLGPCPHDMRPYVPPIRINPSRYF